MHITLKIYYHFLGNAFFCITASKQQVKIRASFFISRY